MSSERQQLMFLKARLGAKVESFKERYDNAKVDYDVIVRAIELLDMQDSDVPKELGHKIPSRDIDFTGARNLPERLERIACNNNGWINITKAAELLIEVKQSGSKKKNLRSMVYRVLAENSDEWEKTAPGTFRLRNANNTEKPDILLLPLTESNVRN